MKTETRFVKCGGVGFTIVCNPDDTVAKLVRTRSDAELCGLLSMLRR